MKNRLFNIFLILLGMLFVGVGVHALSLEYAIYGGGFEPGWVPTILYLLFGIGWIAFGLIGYFRGSKTDSDDR
jgi:hypothetical protein